MKATKLTRSLKMRMRVYHVALLACLMACTWQCSQAQLITPQSTTRNLTQAMMNMGRSVIKSQVDRALFVGHYYQGLLPDYASTDLLKKNWQTVNIPSLSRDNKVVTLIMRSNQKKLRQNPASMYPLERDHCHILFLHGNAGNLFTIVDNLDNIERRLQCNLYAVEYTGYTGKPKGRGTPSEEALNDDVKTAIQWLLERIPPSDHLVLYGHSMGAALAVEAASSPEFKPRVTAVLLEAPFLSAIRTRMDYKTNPMFSSAATFLQSIDLFNSEEKIKQVDSPLFIGHSIDDPVIPFEHGQKLLDLYTGAAKEGFFIEADTHTLHNHTDVRSYPYFAAIESFLQSALDNHTLSIGAQGESIMRAMSRQGNGWGSLLGTTQSQTPSSQNPVTLRISATSIPGTKIEANTEVSNIKVFINGGYEASSHVIVVVESVGPVGQAAVSKYKNCLIKSSIGQSVKLSGHFQLGENGRASLELPAVKCTTLANGRQCKAYNYQFLDETNCELSEPLRALDILS